MHKQRGRWEIGWSTMRGVCATDSIGNLGWVIDAPVQMLDHEDWGEHDDLMPVDDPQCFSPWWLKKQSAFADMSEAAPSPTAG